MPRYAAETTVSAERSRAEIEETLKRYGASEFHSGWRAEQALIAFRYKELFVRFIIPLPKSTEKRFFFKEDRYGMQKRLTDQQAARNYEQEIRQRWRALLLVVKAKLEAVECGISTVEQEFLAFIVMPDDRSVLDWLAADVLPSIKEGKMPLLALPAPPKTEQ